MTYLVSQPIVALYYTQLIGDARTPPTLLAASTFNGMAVIGVFLYLPLLISAQQARTPQMRIRTFREEAVLNFMVPPTICRSLAKVLAASTHHFFSYRSVRNFIIDVRRYEISCYLF